MKKYEIRLFNLKNEINSLDEKDSRKMELINQYNDELSEIVIILKKPLPIECELDSKFILDEYKEFKERYEKNGYFTFKKFVNIMGGIAEVRIKDVKERGAKVRAEAIKVFKGCIPSMKEFDFDVILSWKPSKFVEGEVCLVFLGERKSGAYIASAMESKMPIIEEDQDKYVFCYNNEPEFWGPDGTVSMYLEDQKLTKVRYEEVIRQICEECCKDS